MQRDNLLCKACVCLLAFALVEGFKNESLHDLQSARTREGQSSQHRNKMVLLLVWRNSRDRADNNVSLMYRTLVVQEKFEVTRAPTMLFIACMVIAMCFKALVGVIPVHIIYFDIYKLLGVAACRLF